MKILSAEIENFGSYDNLKFDFNGQGLTLISGPTGSGKSTLCDIIPWLLFGRTAKNGAVDEVRPWTDKGITVGTLTVEINNKTLVIYRTRGPNDLAYNFRPGEIERKRGKDLADTQKAINSILGVDAETYLMASYYHEFSPTARFFIASARERRVLTEQMADLSFPKALQEKFSVYRKELKKENDDIDTDLHVKKSTLSYINSSISKEKSKAEKWDEQKFLDIQLLQYKEANFNQIRDLEIKALMERKNEEEIAYTKRENEISGEIVELKASGYNPEIIAQNVADLQSQLLVLDTLKCKECGIDKNVEKRLLLIKNIDKENEKLLSNQRLNVGIERLEADLRRVNKQRSANQYQTIIDAELKKENNISQLLAGKQAEINPHRSTLKDLESNKETLINECNDLELIIKELKLEQTDIELLSSIVDSYRASIIANTVIYIQDLTNKLLEKHFDAEIQVSFDVKESDKLEVTITKNQSVASYTQLSKGQRQLLNLCFSISAMRAVANYSGLSTNCVFFDECMHGLDDEMKVKCHSLLEELPYESVFIVDHAEAFKVLLNNRYDVQLINGVSHIEKST